MKEKNQAAPRRKGSPFTAFLAVVLLITTLVTPFIYYAPKARLTRAVEKSVSEFLDEDVLKLLAGVFWDGSFEASGEQSSLSYTATLPRSAALVQQGKTGSCRVAFQGDELYLQSSGLGEAAYSASKSNAAVQLCDSAFSDAGMPTAQMRLLRSALVLGDAGFSGSLECLKNTCKASFLAGKPAFSAVQEEIKQEGKERKATTFTYEMGEEGLEKALAAWKRTGEQTETREAFAALRGILSALLSENETEEAATRFAAFLSGESSEFESFEKKLLSENSRACLSVTVCKGRVTAGNFFLGGGDFALEARMTLSEKLSKNATWSAQLQAKSGETQLFSLALDSAVTEDSKSALIRKWSYSFNDAVGAICADAGEERGEVIFSWGKEKGDLGLRLVLGEDDLVFRGELLKYKKGKRLDFVVDGVELNGKKISEDDAYTVTLSTKGETPAHREATEELFPDGEGRQELAQLLVGRFQRFAS